MDYFSGLDISMDETHVCVLDREGAVVYESKTISTAEAIADELTKAPSCRRTCSRPGEWRRSCFTSQLGFPVICIESRQAYQALFTAASRK
jgi:transposase